MNVERAKKILKIIGILSIIAGVIGIILGGITLAGGALIGSDQISAGISSAEEADNVATALGLMTVAGLIFVVASVFTLLLGIFSVRASNDVSKIGPAYTLAIIDLVISVISMGLTQMNGFNPSSLMESLGAVALSAVTFWAANTIKKQA